MRFDLHLKTVFEPEEFSLGIYENLFGHYGFYTVARYSGGVVQYAFYYFDVNGDLKMLCTATEPCFIGDINGDGQNELYWAYHDGRELYYTYYSDGAILTVCVDDAIYKKFPEWRFSLQGSVFPTDNQGLMRFDVSYTDADAIQRNAYLVFTKDMINFYAEDR
jgi:hypothetical protein